MTFIFNQQQRAPSPAVADLVSRSMTSPVVRFSVAFLLLASASAGSLPDRAAILPESEGPRLMRQCSRPAPRDVTGFWTPSASEVMALEERLRDFLRKARPELKLQEYYRQYVGVVSGGRKLIYLNAFIHGGLAVNPNKDWKATAVIVCDGGDGFWGVEFDPADSTFYHYGTNGVA